MLVKNIDMMNSVDVLKKMSQLDLPLKLSYKLAKNIMSIDSELTIINAHKQKLIDKYGEKDTEGNLITDERGQIRILDIDGWTMEYSELENLEVDVSIKLISEEELLNCNNINLTPSDIIAISYML